MDGLVIEIQEQVCMRRSCRGSRNKLLLLLVDQSDSLTVQLGALREDRLYPGHAELALR